MCMTSKCPELSLLRAICRSFTSIRWVIQIRLDRGVGPSEPPGDLADREPLLVAVVASKRRSPAPFMHTITDGHCRRRYPWQPTYRTCRTVAFRANPEATSRLDSRSSASGCRPGRQRDRRWRRLPFADERTPLAGGARPTC